MHSMNMSTSAARKAALAVIAAALALAVLPGCKPRSGAQEGGRLSPKPVDTNVVVAVVDGESISAGQVEEIVNARLDAFRQRGGGTVTAKDIEQARNRVLEQLITEAVTRHAVEQSTISIPPDAIDRRIEQITAEYGSTDQFATALARSGYTLDSFRKDVETDLRALALMEAQTGGATTTAAEAEAYFKDNPDDFVFQARVTARHILLKVDADASSNEQEQVHAKLRAIRKEILDGLDFADAARKYSDCPSARDGGYIGIITRDEDSRLFADAAFALPVSNVSDVVDTEMGSHLIFITDAQPVHTASFDEVKADLMKFMTEKKRAQLAEEWMQDLRAKAKVEYR